MGLGVVATVAVAHTVVVPTVYWGRLTVGWYGHHLLLSPFMRLSNAYWHVWVHHGTCPLFCLSLYPCYLFSLFPLVGLLGLLNVLTCKSCHTCLFLEKRACAQFIVLHTLTGEKLVHHKESTSCTRNNPLGTLVVGVVVNFHGCGCQYLLNKRNRGQHVEGGPPAL